MSLRPFRDIKRRKTREIKVGKVKVGGDNPISVQSMTNTLTTDIKATIKQINEIQNEGADIVMPVAGPVGLGSAALASELGTDSLKIIGVDVDQYVLDTKNQSVYLTTVEKGMDATVLGAIESAKNGSFKGGVYVGTLANNGVRIAPYHDLSSSVSNGLNNEIKKLRSSIINGFLSVKN